MFWVEILGILKWYNSAGWLLCVCFVKEDLLLWNTVLLSLLLGTSSLLANRARDLIQSIALMEIPVARTLIFWVLCSLWYHSFSASLFRLEDPINPWEE